MIGVNCLFNEVIPTYTEEYFAELNKIKIETVEDASSVSNFEYLIGVRYVDDESLLEFETTRVTTRVTKHKGLIVGYRAPVLRNGKRCVEDKAPIYIADIFLMLGMSISSTMKGPGQQAPIRGILKQGHSVCEGQDAIQ